jgi:hypothetical protein
MRERFDEAQYLVADAKYFSAAFEGMMKSENVGGD